MLFERKAIKIYFHENYSPETITKYDFRISLEIFFKLWFTVLICLSHKGYKKLQLFTIISLAVCSYEYTN